MCGVHCNFVPAGLGKFSSFLFLAWTMCGVIVIGTCKNLLTIMVRYITQAMIAAKSMITSLQEQLDTTTGFLQQEKEATQRALDLFSSSLLVRSWKRLFLHSSVEGYAQG